MLSGADLLHPNMVTARFIKAVLGAVAALQAPDLPGVGGRIFKDGTNVFPAVLYQVNANPPTTPTLGHLKNTYYVNMVIKAVGKDMEQGRLEETYGLVKGALYGASGLVAGGGRVVTSRETASYDQNYRDPQTSIRYPELGGLWAFTVVLDTP